MILKSINQIAGPFTHVLIFIEFVGVRARGFEITLALPPSVHTSNTIRVHYSEDLPRKLPDQQNHGNSGNQIEHPYAVHQSIIAGAASDGPKRNFLATNR